MQECIHLEHWPLGLFVQRNFKGKALTSLLQPNHLSYSIDIENIYIYNNIKKKKLQSALSIMPKKILPHLKVYSDATLTQGAWVIHRGTVLNFPIPRSFRYSSFETEFYAAYRAIMDNGTDDMRISLHCDHKGLCCILNSGALRRPQRYPHVNDFLTKLLSWMDSKNISLSVRWIPSESNPADGPSRSALMRQDPELSAEDI